MASITELNISSVATQPIVSYGYVGGTYKRSESWTIDVSSVAKGFYGYGYGYDFQIPNPLSPNPYDYFNVFGINSGAVGYGVDGTQSGYEGTNTYQFGFGYELANAVLANNQDTIRIVATVKENGVPQENINVLFRGTPGVTLTKNTAITDANGQAFTQAKMNYQAQNLDFKFDGTDYSYGAGSLPSSGYFSVRAIIDQRPREDEGKTTIPSVSDTLFITDVQTVLSFQSYGYNHYGYGYNKFV